MEVFMARHPIFTVEKKVFGYELLFRNGIENAFPGIDGNVATSTLLSKIFSPFDFNAILDGKQGLINFTKELILQKIPLLLPKEHFIVEVLENIEPDKDIISALSLFKEKGFAIALDDFVYHKKFHPMMELSTIIKFDIKETSLNNLVDIVEQIKSKYNNLTLLAEKIETYDEFELAKEMDFTLFQGYFFSKPEMLSTKSIASSQITKLELINEMGREELNIEKTEELIKNDAAISFKLLRFINSAYFTRINPIDTVKEAITFIGIDELRKFIKIIVISDLNSGKPNELVRTCLIRANMCEKFGRIFKTDLTEDELFTLGLFSLMDVMLDCKMEDILEYINFSDKMKAALLENNKEFNKILNIVISIDQGNWDNNFFTYISGKPIESKLPDIYLGSVKMANSFINA
ncbi:MAG: HDOD domain-containing protein [Deltaproteobacteria bacterium]|jgi:c-di-GMP-related signal transduction protein|nr:HDOD domain-containing protein [Deltaproteobacteria bacterium]